MSAADDPGFEALARRISKSAGFAVEAYKDKCVRRRIAVRMRACGVHTYADYQALLDRSPLEYDRLRDALTINVTRFYRNAETWNLLRRDVFPMLCGPEPGEIRIWSAGCSSGEEAYTIAILAAAAVRERRPLEGAVPPRGGRDRRRPPEPRAREGGALPARGPPRDAARAHPALLRAGGYRAPGGAPGPRSASSCAPSTSAPAGRSGATTT